MKQIELFVNINDYFTTIEEKDHAIQNVSRVGDKKNEEYWYDRIVLTSGSNEVLFNIMVSSGLNYTSDSGVTISELRKLDYATLKSIIQGNTALTSFEEFQYCGIEFLGDDFFSGCTNLRKVTIPKSVKYIDDNVFAPLPSDAVISYCDKDAIMKVSDLPSVTITYGELTDSTPIYHDGNHYSDSGPRFSENILVAVVYADEDEIPLTLPTMKDTVSGQFPITGDEPIRITYYFKEALIPQYCFSGCTKVVGASSKKIVSVNRCAFYTCSGLTSVQFDDDLEILREECFRACSSLQNITLPKNVYSLKSECFAYCTSLTGITSLNPKAPTIPSGYNYQNIFYTSAFTNVMTGGCLTTPVNASGYGDWLVTNVGFLGYYKWSSAQINTASSVQDVIRVTYRVSTTTSPTQILYSAPRTATIEKAELPGGVSIPIDSAYTFQETGDITITYTLKPGVVLSWFPNYLFTQCENIVSVELPTGVTCLSRACFSGCSRLGSINIDNSVKKIDTYAFAGCGSLAITNLGDGVEEIGNAAFYACRSLTNLVFGNHVKSIGASAFTYTDLPETLIIPNSVESLGQYCFASASGITNLVMSSGASVIPDYAFLNCGKLSAVTMPNSITEIGYGAFGGTPYYNSGYCTSYDYIFYPNDILAWRVTDSGRTTYTLKPGTTHINSRCFSGCTALTDITILNTVVSVSAQSFDGTTHLTGITIPDSVINIGPKCFYESGIRTLSIGNSVNKIDNETFYHCRNLETVQLGGNISRIGVSAFTGCWSLTSLTIPETVETFGGCCFAGCSALTSVTLPYNIDSIEYGQFSGCTSLTGITIPNNGKIIYLKNYAFRGCSSLKDIYLPPSVKSGGSYCFAEAVSVTSITIASSSFWGYNNMFSGITMERKNFINIPNWAVNSAPPYGGSEGIVFVDKITEDGLYISGDTLIKCAPGTTSAVVPSGITKISDGCFSACTSLTSITFPDTIKSFYKSGLDRTPFITGGHCPVYGNIYYPNNVVAYRGTSSGLTTYTLKPQTEIIEDNCFRNCTNLTSITVPDTVTEIREDAFAGTPFIESGYCPSYGNIYYPNNVVAYRYVSPDLTEYTLKPGTVSISPEAFRGTACSAIVIPDSVLIIGDFAFCWSQISEAVLGSNVKILGTGAFQSCPNLKKINIPGSIKEYESSIFYGTYIEHLVFEDDVTSIPSIFVNTSEFRSLKTVVIGDGITNIPASAFCRYSSLESVVFGRSVNYIGYYAFSANTSLTDITFTGDKVSASTTSAFYEGIRTGGTIHYPGPYAKNYTALTATSSTYLGRFGWTGQVDEYTGPKPVLTVVYSATSTTKWTRIITSGVEFVDKIEIDGYGEVAVSATCKFPSTGLNTVRITMNTDIVPGYMFYGFHTAPPVVSIDFGTGIKTIGTNCFGFCPTITAITLPNTLIRLYDYALGETGSGGNPRIRNIVLPSSLKYIGDYAFYGLIELTGITLTSSITSLSNGCFTNCGSLQSIELPDTLEKIGEQCFSHCTGLTSITIPSSVVSLGDACFYGCKSLESISLPSKIKTLPHEIFCSCTSLNNVAIPDSVNSIGLKAFAVCTSLTSITIPDSVTGFLASGGSYYSSPSGQTFYGCTNLRNVTLNNTMTEIPPMMFYSCTSLTNITIPDNIKTIRDSSFSYCTGLTSITLPSGIKTIPSSGFCGCKSLSVVNMPESVTAIQYYAFGNCTSLTSLTLNDNITNLYSYSFSGTGIKSLTLPSKLTGLSSYVLVGMSALESIDIGDGIKNIQSNTFSRFPNLSSITIGSSVTEIDVTCFEDSPNLKRIECRAMTAPTIQSDTFKGIPSGGVLYYPAGANYSFWLKNTNYYLGYCGWTGQETP